MKRGEVWMVKSWHGFEQARIEGPERRYQGLRLHPIEWLTGKLARRKALIEHTQFEEKLADA